MCLWHPLGVDAFVSVFLVVWGGFWAEGLLQVFGSVVSAGLYGRLQKENKSWWLGTVITVVWFTDEDETGASAC